MSFLFVDRILSLEPERRITGLKHITPGDTYLVTGRSGQPALLPSLIGETLGQLAAWNSMHVLDFQVRPVAGVVSAVKIHDDAYLGDTLFLEAVIDKIDHTAIEYSAIASINGRAVCEVQHALGPMLPMTDFIDRQTVMSQFEQIHHPGQWQAMEDRYQSTERILPAIFAETRHAGYDHILDWQPGKRVVALKLVSRSAPYFQDHFPQKPVLPLTILLSCHIRLANRFFKNCLDGDLYQRLRLVAMHKIKMKAFISPGQAVTTEMRLKQSTEKGYTTFFQSFVEGRRVCVAEADFQLDT
jgi:3-hydroxymyristoyl/3-hydroxydecanoyl-(acyl carrier protein) dehydratase